jgi:hypothetical protein
MILAGGFGPTRISLSSFSAGQHIRSLSAAPISHGTTLLRNQEVLPVTHARIVSPAAQRRGAAAPPWPRIMLSKTDG